MQLRVRRNHSIEITPRLDIPPKHQPDLPWNPATMRLRQAQATDCSDLTILTDMATRRLNSFFWEKTAANGQSVFEIGRDIIRSQTEHFLHFEDWPAAEQGGQVLGAFTDHIILPADRGAGQPASSDILTPLQGLKSLAAGSWYLSAAAVVREARGRGVGAAMLMKAEELAPSSQCRHLTLMLGSFNTDARRLYRRHSFQEWDTRQFPPFRGSGQGGSWIL